MKKLILIAALALVGLSAQAERMLLLRHSAGTHSMPLAKVVQVVFTDNGVQAQLTDNSVYSVDGLQNFVSIKVVDPSGVTDIAGAQPALSFDGSVIDGAGSAVTVYNAAGVVVAQSADGVVDASSLAPGAYIAVSQGQTLKIVKK